MLSTLLVFGLLLAGVTVALSAPVSCRADPHVARAQSILGRWEATILVDNNTCPGDGDFELAMVLQKENAPDITFLQKGHWREGQREATVLVRDLAPDEAIGEYWVRNASCSCR